MKKVINIADIASTPLLVKDYLNQEKSIQDLYNLSFSKDNIIAQAKNKLSHYSSEYRTVLTSELSKQLSAISLTDKQKKNLDNLSLNNSVTITTGHQLNLMTGPLYFIYKILHVIKLCDSLNKEQKDINFVPIFWMATEDHDFDEINHFFYKGKKIAWKEHHEDYVGEIGIDSKLKEALAPFYKELNLIPYGKKLQDIIDKSYLSCPTLAEATRVLVHEIFKDYGLLILDGNAKELKELYKPIIKDDLVEQKSYIHTSKTIEKLKDNYKIQVNPREINFFYRTNNTRKRIEKTGNNYTIVDTSLQLTQEEILKELDANPQNFSPNALMRPVYQETILPNAAYIGGNAEIAYWLELKQYFDAQSIDFPILIPRNSFLILEDTHIKKMAKYNWNTDDILKSKADIINNIAKSNAEIDIDFSNYKDKLNSIFSDFLSKASKTDKSWEGMVLAQQAKQNKGLEKVEKRLLLANKKKNQELITNFEKFYTEIFPNNSWQERVENFSYLYGILEHSLIDTIYSELDEYNSNYILKTLNF